MINWPYLAGFLDGDGWISKSQNRNCKTKAINIGFTQLCIRRHYMEEIRSFLLKNNVQCHIYNRKAPSNIHKEGFAMMTNVYIKGIPSVIKFLSETIPFLLIKKQKAKECYKYLLDKEDKRAVPIQLPNGYKEWDKKEIKMLLYMKRKNFTYNSIAKRLNRSSTSVIKKYFKLKNGRTIDATVQFIGPIMPRRAES